MFHILGLFVSILLAAWSSPIKENWDIIFLKQNKLENGGKSVPMADSSVLSLHIFLLFCVCVWPAVVCTFLVAAVRPTCYLRSCETARLSFRFCVCKTNVGCGNCNTRSELSREPEICLWRTDFVLLRDWEPTLCKRHEAGSSKYLIWLWKDLGEVADFHKCTWASSVVLDFRINAFRSFLGSREESHHHHLLKENCWEGISYYLMDVY